MATLGSEEALETRIEKVAGRQRFSAALLCSYVVLGKSLDFSERHVRSGVGIRALCWQDD